VFIVVGRKLLSSGWLVEGLFLKCNKQAAYFRGLKRITKLSLVSFARCQHYHCFYYLPLVLACHYPHVHPYIQQYCSYTVEVSSLLAEEARISGSAVNIRYSSLCQDIHVHRATGRNRATKFTVFTYWLHTRKIKENQYVWYVVSLEIKRGGLGSH
jgi:hypothetical protein